MNPPDSQTDYAFWTIPGTSVTVTYSLGVFQEIDFEVNEGFRRIAHGGVEVGGVLWGRMKADSVVIENFRPIESEHALGPSFVLSERDITELKEQLAKGARDPELAGMTALGWFIARTRNPLMMLDRDATLFEQFFPLPGSITLLVKPERFQPTRFSFIVRDGNGQVNRDTAQHAVILPLAGRTSQASVAPVPSIIAPADRSVAPEKTATSPSEPIQPLSPQPDQTIEAPAVQPPVQLFIQPPPVTPPATDPVTKEQLFESEEPPAAARDRQAITRPRPEARAEANLVTERPVITPPAPVRPPPLPSIEEIKKRRAELLETADAPSWPVSRETRTIPTRAPSGLRLLTVLLVAGLLGCGTGYLAYLQLPAAIIEMRVQRRGTRLIVFWPADQTRSASAAAIRMDDGRPVALTADEKANGHMEFNSTSDNLKLELIAQHWIRDSRGIVRYVRPVSPGPPVKRTPAPDSEPVR